MRAILTSVAILFMSGAILAQERRLPTIVQRTFVPDEPVPCIAFNRMAARLDAVYKTEEISKSDYDEGLKNYKDGRQVEDVDYFMSGKDKYQRIFLRRDKRAEVICLYLVEGGRGEKSTGHFPWSIELGEEKERYFGVFTLRPVQGAMSG